MYAVKAMLPSVGGVMQQVAGTCPFLLMNPALLASAPEASEPFVVVCLSVEGLSLKH